MNSPKILNYETRPIKFTERKMLLASLSRICNFFGGNYQYIGLGGLAFSDFKLFHKELHISELFSIEGGDFSQEKLEYNSPFSFIKIIKDHSTIALNSIDLTKKTFIWLDYDGTLENYMFEDITALFSKLPIGSIYLLTCNRELKVKETRKEYTSTEFEEKFGSLIPFKLNNIDFSATNAYKTIRIMLKNQIDKILENRSKNEDGIEFYQLYNLIYQEFRGASMYTYGGIIGASQFKLSLLNLSTFEFIKYDETPYHLEIPNLTRKEIELANSYFNEEPELLQKNIITKKELDIYKKTYKYIPAFFDVRL